MGNPLVSTKLSRVREPIDVIRDTEYFSDLGESALVEMAEACQYVELNRGETLFEEGEKAESFYILAYGRLGVWSGRRRITAVQPKECVGEVALLRDRNRTETVKAERDCLLLQLTKKSFESLLENHPKAMLRVALHVTDRLAGAYVQTTKPPQSIAIVPMTTHPEFERFCQALQRSLNKKHPTLLALPSDRLPGIDWFTEAEQNHGTVLYQCRRGLCAWSERCLRQADRVMVVGVEAEPQPPGVHEQYWSGLHKRDGKLLMVLLGFGKAKRSSQWLANREDVQVHHLEWIKSPDRIARFINREAFGLVLGGGGARGLAHVGVFKALEERGIKPDLVAGTSMGGFCASLLASGRTAAEVERELRWVWIDAGPFLDFTFPLYSLVSGDRVRGRLIRIFGQRHIEDLDLPFFCMTADITNAQSVVHDRGLLYRWLAVGMSIPGVAPPYPDNGRLLLDGGLLNNLPVDVASEAGCGEILAINVDPKEEMAIRDEDFEGSLSKQLWRKMAGTTTAPHIVETMIRVTTLTNAAAIGRMRHLIDHYVQPDTDRFGLFDFHMANDIIKSGYEAMIGYSFTPKHMKE
jgi:NTE family protein